MSEKIQYLYEKLNIEEGERISLLQLSYDHFFGIKEILEALPDIFDVLSKISTEKMTKEVEEIAVEINEIFKKLLLFGDKVEIRLCLKEGYLTQFLRPTMDRFYTDAILGKRTNFSDVHPLLEGRKEQVQQKEWKKREKKLEPVIAEDEKKEDSDRQQIVVVAAAVAVEDGWEQKKPETAVRQGGRKGGEDKEADGGEKKEKIKEEQMEKKEGSEQYIYDLIVEHIAHLNSLKDKSRKNKPKQETNHAEKKEEERKGEAAAGEAVQEEKQSENKADFKTNIDVKIELLEILLKEKKPKNIDELGDSLKELRRNRRKDIELLYRGKTGILLKKLEYAGASKDDIKNELSTELALLKKQRGKRYFFNNIQKAELLEKRIVACENLLELIKCNKVAKALQLLSKDNMAILKENDKILLRKIEWIEKAVPVEDRIKTILRKKEEAKVEDEKRDLRENAKEVRVEAQGGFQEDNEKEVKHSKKTAQRVTGEGDGGRAGEVTGHKDKAKAGVREGLEEKDSKYDHLPSEKRTALRLIDCRISVLEKAWRNRADKVEVLKKLKEKLKKEDVSLGAALAQMNAEKVQNIHLLFEGFTGETMKMLQNAEITKEELIHRLDAEINLLKQQRYQRFWFFENYHKLKIEDNIDKLKQLRKAIASTQDNNVLDVTAGLGEQDKAILEQYEADLMRDLRRFDDIKRTNFKTNGAATVRERYSL